MRSIMKMTFVAFLILSFAIVLAPAYVCADAQEVETLQQININTASLDELAKVEGIESEHAQAIIDYRKTHGPFETVDDLMKVKGISSEAFEAIKGMLVVK